MNNSAIEYGGAIVFIQDLNQIKKGVFIGNRFIGNYGKIAGAYYYQGYKIEKGNNSFIQNKGELNGDEVFSYPTNLRIIISTINSSSSSSSSSS